MEDFKAIHNDHIFISKHNFDSHVKKNIERGEKGQRKNKKVTYMKSVYTQHLSPLVLKNDSEL